MKWKQLTEAAGEKTYVLVFDTGDEAKSVLEGFARERGLTAAHFTGIGAFSDVTLGYFNWERKEYEEIPLDEQVEVAAFSGDVATKDGEAQVHAHLVVGDSSGRAYAGHLIAGHVRPTLEVVLTETPAQLRKEIDEATGLALIALD